jgi:carboxymethylenebutenolidase
VPYYGVGGYDQVDLSRITAPILGHFGEQDDFAPPSAVEDLREKLEASGAPEVDLRVHPGAGHAFFNDENHLGTYDPELAASTWRDTVAFLRDRLG